MKTHLPTKIKMTICVVNDTPFFAYKLGWGLAIFRGFTFSNFFSELGHLVLKKISMALLHFHTPLLLLIIHHGTQLNTNHNPKPNPKGITKVQLCQQYMFWLSYESFSIFCVMFFLKGHSQLKQLCIIHIQYK